MGTLIKFKLNSPYLFIYFLSWHVRHILKIVIDDYLSVRTFYIDFYLMTLGMIIGGLLVYNYQYKSVKHEKEIKYFDLELIYNTNVLVAPDGQYKKLFLIIFAAVFDFVQFSLDSYFGIMMDKIISPTFDLRLGCLTTIVSSLLCTYTIGFVTGKHQKMSLIIMSLCLIAEIVLEIALKPANQIFGYFILARVLIIFEYIFDSFDDCVEKYLVEVNFLNPFKVVMLKGIIELILSIFYSIGKDPFGDVIKVFRQKDVPKIICLFLLFLAYFFLSAMVNVYKIYCNVIYTPMKKSLMDYFMTPFYNIYYFLKYKDFYDNKIYFIVSEIISLTIDFFGLLYNEFIILFCCGLEHETKSEIKRRATIHEILKEDEEDEEEVESEHNNDIN